MKNVHVIDNKIYITSDKEIKKGEEQWFLTKDLMVLKSKNVNEKSYSPIGKKIILTTDQELITDGIQAIDNEFVIWFENNPTCDRVETKIIAVNEFGSEITVDSYGFDKFIHKIVFPKLEPKQGSLLEAINQVINNILAEIDESKQEILKKAAIDYIKNKTGPLAVKNRR